MEPVTPNQKIPNLLRPTVPQALSAEPVSSSASIERRRFWKLFAFDVLAVLAAGAVAEATLQYIAGNLRFGFFVPIVSFFLIVSFFDFLLSKDPGRRTIVVALQIVGFLAFFYAVKITAILAAAGILAVFALLAEHSGRRVADNALEFHLGTVARAYMKKVFVGFVLATIVLFLPQIKAGSVFVSEDRFQRWYDSAAVIAHGFYGSIDFTASVGSFSEAIVRAELANNAEYQKLPPAAQEETVHANAQNLITQASQSIGFALTAEMPLAHAFYRYIVLSLGHFKDQFGQSFLAVWAAALFFIIWSVGTLFVWITILAAYLVYELLAAMNLVRLAGETRTKEVVELG